MPVISLASPKGGAGKSTSAVLLACELAEAGRKVTVIDADPNRPVFKWAQRPGKPETLTVLEDVTEETIIDTIENASIGSNFVIVDLEGTASIMVALAISRADLVIIPSQGSHLDAEQAARAVQLVRMNEKRFRVAIPMAVLFTRTSAAIRTRDLKRIEPASPRLTSRCSTSGSPSGRLTAPCSPMAARYRAWIPRRSAAFRKRLRTHGPLPTRRSPC